MPTSNYDYWKLSEPDESSNDEESIICDSCGIMVYPGNMYIIDDADDCTLCSIACAFGVTEKDQENYLSTYHDVEKITLEETVECDYSGATYDDTEVVYHWVDRDGCHLYEHDLNVLIDFLLEFDDVPLRIERA